MRSTVDVARFESAPCYLCGYGGEGYFQPTTHPCASAYHAAKQRRADRRAAYGFYREPLTYQLATDEQVVLRRALFRRLLNGQPLENDDASVDD
jgi:hypothetical protein